MGRCDCSCNLFVDCLPNLGPGESVLGSGLRQLFGRLTDDNGIRRVFVSAGHELAAATQVRYDGWKNGNPVACLATLTPINAYDLEISYVDGAPCDPPSGYASAGLCQRISSQTTRVRFVPVRPMIARNWGRMEPELPYSMPDLTFHLTWATGRRRGMRGWSSGPEWDKGNLVLIGGFGDPLPPSGTPISIAPEQPFWFYPDAGPLADGYEVLTGMAQVAWHDKSTDPNVWHELPDGQRIELRGNTSLQINAATAAGTGLAIVFDTAEQPEGAKIKLTICGNISAELTLTPRHAEDHWWYMTDGGRDAWQTDRWGTLDLIGPGVSTQIANCFDGEFLAPFDVAVWPFSIPSLCEFSLYAWWDLGNPDVVCLCAGGTRWNSGATRYYQFGRVSRSQIQSHDTFISVNTQTEVRLAGIYVRRAFWDYGEVAPATTPPGVAYWDRDALPPPATAETTCFLPKECPVALFDQRPQYAKLTFADWGNLKAQQLTVFRLEYDLGNWYRRYDQEPNGEPCATRFWWHLWFVREADGQFYARLEAVFLGTEIQLDNEWWQSDPLGAVPMVLDGRVVTLRRLGGPLNIEARVEFGEVDQQLIHFPTEFVVEISGVTGPGNCDSANGPLIAKHAPTQTPNNEWTGPTVILRVTRHHELTGDLTADVEVFWWKFVEDRGNVGATFRTTFPVLVRDLLEGGVDVPLTEGGNDRCDTRAAKCKVSKV
jgi:hypothetical protein